MMNLNTLGENEMPNSAQTKSLNLVCRDSPSPNLQSQLESSAQNSIISNNNEIALENYIEDSNLGENNKVDLDLINSGKPNHKLEKNYFTQTILESSEEPERDDSKKAELNDQGMDNEIKSVINGNEKDSVINKFTNYSPKVYNIEHKLDNSEFVSTDYNPPLSSYKERYSGNYSARVYQYHETHGSTELTEEASRQVYGVPPQILTGETITKRDKVSQPYDHCQHSMRYEVPQNSSCTRPVMSSLSYASRESSGYEENRYYENSSVNINYQHGYNFRSRPVEKYDEYTVKQHRTRPSHHANFLLSVNRNANSYHVLNGNRIKNSDDGFVISQLLSKEGSTSTRKLADGNKRGRVGRPSKLWLGVCSSNNSLISVLPPKRKIIIESDNPYSKESSVICASERDNLENSGKVKRKYRKTKDKRAAAKISQECLENNNQKSPKRRECRIEGTDSETDTKKTENSQEDEANKDFCSTSPMQQAKHIKHYLHSEFEAETDRAIDVGPRRKSLRSFKDEDSPVQGKNITHASLLPSIDSNGPYYIMWISNESEIDIMKELGADVHDLLKLYEVHAPLLSAYCPYRNLLDDGNGAEQLDQPNDADYSIYFTKTAKKFKECKSNGNVIIIVFNLLDEKVSGAMLCRLIGKRGYPQYELCVKGFSGSYNIRVLKCKRLTYEETKTLVELLVNENKKKRPKYMFPVLAPTNFCLLKNIIEEKQNANHRISELLKLFPSLSVVKFQDFLAHLKHFELLEEGTFGTIYIVTESTSHVDSVAKIFKSSCQTEVRFNEIKVLTMLQGIPAVPDLLHVLEENSSMGDSTNEIHGYVIEKFDCTLQEYARHNLSAPQIYEVVYKLNSGLKEFHSRRLAHLDLCDRNVMILVSEIPSVKIIDYAAAVCFPATNKLYLPTNTAKLNYRPPEIFTETTRKANVKKVDVDPTKIDVWGLSVLIMELLNRGMKAWSGQFDASLLHEVISDAVLIEKHIINVGGPRWQHLLRKGLEVHPNNRWSCEEIETFLIKNKRALISELETLPKTRGRRRKLGLVKNSCPFEYNFSSTQELACEKRRTTRASLANNFNSGSDNNNYYYNSGCNGNNSYTLRESHVSTRYAHAHCPYPSTNQEKTCEYLFHQQQPDSFISKCTRPPLSNKSQEYPPENFRRYPYNSPAPSKHPPSPRTLKKFPVHPPVDSHMFLDSQEKLPDGSSYSFHQSHFVPFLSSYKYDFKIQRRSSPPGHLYSLNPYNYYMPRAPTCPRYYPPPPSPRAATPHECPPCPHSCHHHPPERPFFRPSEEYSQYTAPYIPGRLEKSKFVYSSRPENFTYCDPPRDTKPSVVPDYYYPFSGVPLQNGNKKPMQHSRNANENNHERVYYNSFSTNRTDKLCEPLKALYKSSRDFTFKHHSLDKNIRKSNDKVYQTNDLSYNNSNIDNENNDSIDGKALNSKHNSFVDGNDNENYNNNNGFDYNTCTSNNVHKDEDNLEINKVNESKLTPLQESLPLNSVTHDVVVNKCSPVLTKIPEIIKERHLEDEEKMPTEKLN